MKTITEILKRLSKTDIAAILCFCAAFIYLMTGACFYRTITDEAFYISIPLRLINGDGMLTDEWHLSQFSAVLLYPAVKLFTAVTGSTAGIILYMRRLFCLFQITAGAYLYKILKKEGPAALIISLTFIFYSVIALRTLSYNTLGVGILFCICAMAYDLSRKPSYIKMFLLGILTAAFVLCQPIGVVFYVIYFVAVCIMPLKYKKKEKVPFPFSFRSFLMTAAGILPVFIFFLYLLLKNSDIETIIKCIPGILSDIEHMRITEDLGIKTFSAAAFFTDMTMAAGIIPLILSPVCILIAVMLRKRNRYAAIIIACAGLIAFIMTFYFRLVFMSDTTETDDINFFFLPFALIGPAFYILTEKKNSKAFILFWSTGMLYAVFMTISSNLRLHSSVNGYIIAFAATLIFANDLIKELREQQNPPAVVKPAVISLIVSVFAYSVLNVCIVCTSENINRAAYNSAKPTGGIYEGIALPSDQALLYTRLYKDSLVIKEKLADDDRLFVAENFSAVYLETEALPGVFSGWFICEQLSIPEIRDRFREYYEINPENFPDYIYVPSYSYTQAGINPVPAKAKAKFPYLLFEGTAEDIGNGLLIKVTGIKDE